MSKCNYNDPMPEVGNVDPEELINAISEQFRKRIAGTVEDILGNNYEVDDVIQEALIKIFRALPFFHGKSQLYTWFYRIAVNLANNRKRSYVGKHKTLLAANIDLPEKFQMQYDRSASEEYLPFYNLFVDEDNRMLRHSIRKLSPEMRKTVMLCYFEKYSYQEIAQSLNCSPGTVKSRLNRAKALLHKEFIQQLKKFNKPEKKTYY